MPRAAPLSEMPNSDTWPRAVSVETLSNMDSARSCDSVISVNSACSEDSMEHLSAEEKACLMYLEETIESLDLQEDSGFSNDEPESGIRRVKHGGTEALPQPDISGNILTVLSENSGPSAATETSSETENPASHSSQTSPSSTPDISDPDLPSHIPPDPTPAPPESASGSATPVPAQDAVEPSLPTAADPQTNLSAKREMDLSVIPPPSDFMDKPVSPPTQRNSSPILSASAKPTINLEMLRRRVSEKNIPGSNLSVSVNPTPPASVNPAPLEHTSVSPMPTTPAPMEPITVNEALPENPAPPAESPPTPSLQPSDPVTMEPKSPPAVAPKPKKLPPNIILKSHRPSGGHDSIMGHPSPTDRVIMDPQKVRMEALRKLGLLKSEDSDSGPAVNPKSLQTRKSWAPSSSPLSPNPPKSAPPSAPHFTQVPVHVPSEPLPDIIPVPAAFSDPVAQSHDDVFLGVSDRGSPGLDKKFLPSPGGGGVKSATLERSGLGLSSYMEAMDKQQTLGQLRNSRPRPASLGSGKDFVGEKSVPAPSSHPDNPQKLPRSQGISVIISPGEQGEQSRRQALRKLGLLRD